MKEHKHLGAYALIIKDGKILLIKKYGGPYDGKLDLPGGTIDFGETPVKALIRELKEEVGINIKRFELFDADSVAFDWQFKDDMIRVHHMGIFFKVYEYSGNIKSKIDINEQNDDSLGASFYEISKLKQKDLSRIALLELNKLGYLEESEE